MSTPRPASQLPLSPETRASSQSLPLKEQEVPTAPQGTPWWLRKEALSLVRGRARAWEEPQAWVPKPRVKCLLKYQRLHVCQTRSSGFSKHYLSESSRTHFTEHKTEAERES